MLWSLRKTIAAKEALEGYGINAMAEALLGEGQGKE